MSEFAEDKEQSQSYSTRITIRPTLNERCMNCGYRGHREPQCHLFNENPQEAFWTLAEIYTQFEGLGYHSCLSTANVNCGFFLLPEWVQNKLLDLTSVTVTRLVETQVTVGGLNFITKSEDIFD